MTPELQPIPPRQLGEMVAGEMLRRCWLANEHGDDLDLVVLGSIDVLPTPPEVPFIHPDQWPNSEVRGDSGWVRDYHLGVVTVLTPACGWQQQSAAVRDVLRRSSATLTGLVA
jgi:hypothetical protein